MIPSNRDTGLGPSQDPVWVPFDPELDGSPAPLLSLRSNESGKGKVIVMVVAEAGDNGDWAARASLRAAELCSATDGDALLIDLDLLNLGLGRLLREPAREGITDVVLFSCSLGRASRAVESSTLSFVPVGTVVADPAAILRHECWGDLLRELVEGGTTVLLNVPAGAHGAEALIERADALVVLGPPTGLPDLGAVGFEGPIAWLGPDSDGLAVPALAGGDRAEPQDDSYDDASLLSESDAEEPLHAPSGKPTGDETDPVEGPGEQDEPLTHTEVSGPVHPAHPRGQADPEAREAGDVFGGEFAKESVEAIDAVFSEPAPQPEQPTEEPESATSEGTAEVTDSLEREEPDPWAAPPAHAGGDGTDVTTDEPWLESTEARSDWPPEEPTDSPSLGDAFEGDVPGDGATEVGRSSLAAEFDGLPEVAEERPRNRARLLTSVLILVVVAGTTLVLAMPGEAPESEAPIRAAPSRASGTETVGNPQLDDPLAALGEDAAGGGPEDVAGGSPEDVADRAGSGDAADGAGSGVVPGTDNVSPNDPEDPPPVGTEPEVPHTSAAPDRLEPGPVPTKAVAGSTPEPVPTKGVAGTPTGPIPAKAVAGLTIPAEPPAVPAPSDPRWSDASTGVSDSGAAAHAAASEPAAVEEPAVADAGPITDAESPEAGRPGESPDPDPAPESTEPASPGRSAAEEPALRTLDRPAGLMAYALEVGSHSSFPAARKQASTLQARHGDLEFTTVPVARANGLTYRVLAGPAASLAEAESIRSALAPSFGPGVLVGAEVRATGWAFLLGVFENPNEALARVQTARSRNVPVTMAEVPINDSHVVYRVYSGAFGSEDEAAALGDLLEAAGLGPVRLTERMGRPVF